MDVPAAAVIPAEDPGAPASAGPAAAGLASVTADGAVWMLVMSVLTRVISFGGQVVLARLLVPDDFGVLALAGPVAGLAGSIGTLGIGPFLMFRQRRLDRYVDTAFWMTVVFGLVNAMIIALAAPVAAWVYHDRRLYGLLLFSAAAAPLTTLLVVPSTLAGIQLRFKLLATLLAFGMVAQVATTVTAAALGLGAYSVLIGTATSVVIRLAALWRVVRPRFRFAPRRSFRAERTMLWGTSGWILGTAMLTTVLAQGDYATMGFFFRRGDIGYYYYAFNLAQQAVSLLGSSLGNVLYPAIARLNGDRDRQVGALLRAMRILALAGTPACVLMVFGIPPLVRLVAPDFVPSIAIAQVMSVGAIAVLAGTPVISLIQAQARFRYYFFHTLLIASMFLACVLLGCLTHRVLGVAVAVSAFFWIGGPLGCVLGIDGFRPRLSTVRRVAAAMGLPLVWTLPAAAVATGVYWGLGADGSLPHAFARSTAACVAFLAVALPSLWLGMPETSREFVGIAGGVAGRLRPARSKGTA